MIGSREERRAGALTRRALAAAGLGAAGILSPLAAPGAVLASRLDLADGLVVNLAETPHLWVAHNGVLHWAADTRALAGKSVLWETRTIATLDGLRALPIGDPWLSAALVKIGDAMYLPRWESSQPAPQLLRVSSLADLELFGVDGTNYGRYVLDQPAWEQRYGFATAALPKDVLAPAAGQPAVSVFSPAAPRLVVSRLSLNGGRGTMEGRGWIVGEVRNAGDAAATGYSLKATLKDDHGVIVGVHRAEAKWRLPPGTAYPFTIPVQSLPRGSQVDVRASPAGAAAAAGRYTPLSTNSVYLREEGQEKGGVVVSRTFRVLGNVVNDTGEDATDVRILVAFLDGSGRIVDVQGDSTVARANATTLAADDAIGFGVDSAPSSVNARVAGITGVRAFAFGSVFGSR